MKEVSKKILTLPLRVAIVVLIFGALFKVMHWPYSTELLLTSVIVLLVLYIIRFSYKNPKEYLDYIKLVMVLLWILGSFSKVFHVFKNRYIIDICLAILVLYWFIKYDPNYLSKRAFKTHGILKVFYQTLKILALLGLFFGFLFKIQHWPYGELLFTLGILILCVILVLDYFVRERA